MEKVTAEVAKLAVDESAADRKLLIAVDFGTTYSGVAWAQTRRVCSPLLHWSYPDSFFIRWYHLQPDVQTIIIQWPDSGSGGLEGISSDKVPT